MKKIVLISCVSKKLDVTSKAEDLYISPLFKYNLQYAKSLKPDMIFILSAKYGLLELGKEIEPYNLTLNTMKSNEIKVWANEVLEQLKSKTDIVNDSYLFLAGSKYRKFLVPEISHYDVPMQHLGIGKQLQWLKLRCQK